MSVRCVCAEMSCVDVYLHETVHRGCENRGRVVHQAHANDGLGMSFPRSNPASETIRSRSRVAGDDRGIRPVQH